MRDIEYYDLLPKELKQLVQKAIEQYCCEDLYLAWKEGVPLEIIRMAIFEHEAAAKRREGSDRKL